MATANQYSQLRRLLQTTPAKLVGRGGKSVALPPDVQTLLSQIDRSMEAGMSVSVIAEQQELTTQRAAGLLGVSRPYLVSLLEAGHLPFHKVGTHRRVNYADLLAYKSRRDRARHTAIRALAREDVAAGVYDAVILPPGAQDE